jgi:hypothetical protein
MFEIKKFGYMPAYGPYSKLGFTKQLPVSAAVSFDSIDTDFDCDFRVVVQCEPPKIYGNFHDIVVENQDKFDLILTYDERLLKLPKAQEFLPVDAWIGDLQLQKRDQITYVMSSKIFTPEHIMRFVILKEVINKSRLGNFEFLMHRSPPRIESKEQYFVNAKFNIVCENQCMNNMFTEKLLDCFRSRTVPIYYGCTNIDKYFDTRGMLRFWNIEQFKNIVYNLTPADYDRMLPYIEDNYHRSRYYWQKTVYQRVEDVVEQEWSKISNLKSFGINTVS